MNKFEEALKLLMDTLCENGLNCGDVHRAFICLHDGLSKLEDIVECVQTMADSIKTDVKMAYHMDGAELPSINLTLKRIDKELELGRSLFKAILGKV